ncbi:MAG: hypothetical protein ABJL67_15690 [Sulfitobacter sp.]
MAKYLTIAALLACLGLALALWWQGRGMDALEAENTRLTRSVAALTLQAEQSALARNIEAARAKRFAKRNTQLNAAIEGLLTGDIKDAPLDPRLADFVNGLRGAH